MVKVSVFIGFFIEMWKIIKVVIFKVGFVCLFCLIEYELIVVKFIII